MISYLLIVTLMHALKLLMYLTLSFVDSVYLSKGIMNKTDKVNSLIDYTIEFQICDGLNVDVRLNVESRLNCILFTSVESIKFNCTYHKFKISEFQ